jgi:hypothetical protein
MRNPTTARPAPQAGSRREQDPGAAGPTFGSVPGVAFLCVVPESRVRAWVAAGAVRTALVGRTRCVALEDCERLAGREGGAP